MWYVGVCHSRLYSQNSREVYHNEQNEIDLNYSHYDQKTTEILDFFAGKKSLPAKIKAELEIKILYNIVLQQEEIANTTHSDFEFEDLASSLDELWKEPEGLMKYWKSSKYVNDNLKVYLSSKKFDTVRTKNDSIKVYFLLDHFIKNRKLSKDTAKGLNLREIKKMVSQQCNDLVQFENFSQSIFSSNTYKSIWTMHYLHGNPKIDFSEDFSNELSYGNRAYYDSPSNTIYIGVFPQMSIEQFVSDWIAELSHAEQWKQYSDDIMTEREVTENSYLDSLCKMYNCQYQFIMDKIKDSFYLNSHLFNGYYTVEYEAHQIIEPVLWEEFRKLLKVE